jgi:hypothetical protein
MKRMIISTVLGGIVASLLLGLPSSRGGRSGIVAKVHAQGAAQWLPYMELTGSTEQGLRPLVPSSASASLHLTGTDRAPGVRPYAGME